MIEAMKQALEALEELHDTNSYWWQEIDETTLAKMEPAITALRTAIEQAEKQAPVAWISPKGNIHFDPYLDSAPLYTTPPAAQRQPLTDEKINEIAAQGYSRWVEFARAIEAAHGIKGEA
jgi:hypothetical protein